MTGPYATGAPLYWKAGFTCPLPLAGKVLTVKGYTGHDGALVSWPDLQSWIETRGQSNIGLRAAGWIGLDVDAYGAKVGAQSWASALAELGELPATVSSTARGPGQPSRIYLYRVPSAAVFDDAQRRFGEAFGPNVDVIHRSHRYIAVWPSLNPDAEGAPYRWYDPAGAVVDGVPELGQLPDLPGPWLEFLAGGTVPSSERKAASPTLPGDPFTSPGHTPWTRAQMLAQVNPLLERLAAHGRPGRTALDDLMAAALVTYRFVPAFMTREKADQVLLARLLERDQADGASDPTTWKWSARHELEKAWKDRAYEAEAADDPDPDLAPDGSDPAGAGPDAQERRVLEELERERARREARRRLADEEAEAVDQDALERLHREVLTSAGLDDLPELEALVAGWLFRDTTFRVVGASNTFKSFVVVDLLCRIAAGRQWWGYATAQGLAVYVVAEGGRGVRKRIRAWEQRYNDGAPLEGLRILPRPVQVTGPEWSAFVEVCRDLEASVIVLDTQARVTVGVDENSNTEMGLVVDMAERLRAATGAAVGFVHHTGHAGDHGRGATAFYGALQTEISIRRPEGGMQIELRASKQKDHDQLGPVSFKMVEVPLATGDAFAGAVPDTSLVMANLDASDGGESGKDRQREVEHRVRRLALEQRQVVLEAACLIASEDSPATKAEIGAAFVNLWCARTSNPAYSIAGRENAGNRSSWNRAWREARESVWLASKGERYWPSEDGISAAKEWA